MRNNKNKYLFIASIIIASVLFLACSLSFGVRSQTAYADEDIYDGYTIHDIRGMLEESSDLMDLEVYAQDGTMGKIQIPSASDAIYGQASRSNYQVHSTFNEQILIDSGKSDNQSIVITIMGDGFTNTQQTDFINAAKSVVSFMLGDPATGAVGFYPFNLFRDCFTVYAIEVISNETGVSRDVDDTVYDRNNDDNNPKVNNYFGSTFYGHSHMERALVISDYTRANALKKPNTSMAAILCNSTRWGGTGGDYAITSLADISSTSNYRRIMTHEFGHSFGELADEYYYDTDGDGTFNGQEAANMTANSNPATVKWSAWIGYKNVGIFPYSSSYNTADPNFSINHPNFDPASNNWFRPHQDCHMQVTSSDFCPVCAAELIRKMELIVGPLFNTTDIGTNNIRIDSTNINFTGQLTIPERINGRIVTEIGFGAFVARTDITHIIIPTTVTLIGNSAFQGLSNITGITFDTPSQLQTIGNYAFSYVNCTDLTLPNSVTSIGSSAFAYCTNLNNVNIPSNVTSIGIAAFAWCTSLSSITFSSPSNLQNIGNFAFANSGVTNITLPNNVISIGASAFEHCTNLSSVSIPSSVTSIGDNAFGVCTSLATISVNSSNSIYSSQNGILYNKAKTSFIHIPLAVAGSVTIPSGVTTISNYAFYNRIGITSITFSNSLTGIGGGAFWGCSGISNLTIPASVLNIGSYAFCECTNLTSVTLSSGVGSIGESTFSGCSKIASLTVPGSVESIGINAFKDCVLIGNVVLQQGVASLGEYAFSGCISLSAVTIPQSVVSITSNTFFYCPSLSSLTWYYNPNYSATDLNIKNYLTNVVFNSGITTIGVRAFSNSSNLTSITIPNTITSIGSSAFSNISGLTQILIPSSVTSIGEYAFSACNSIKIYSEASSKPSGWNVDWNPQYRPVYYYSAASKVNCWRYVNNVPTIWYIEGTEGLAFTLLSDGTLSVIGISTVGLLTLVIPSTYNGLTVTKVGNGSAALSNSYYLQTVVINNGIKSIEASAFSGCSWLSSITMPNSVTNIGANAFQNCISLTTVPIPNSVTNIGASAFSGCTSLAALTIPQSVVSVGANAFANCYPSLYIVWNYNPSLTAANFKTLHYEVNFPVGTSQISANAFANSSKLNIITIPNTITSIGANAFANCNSSLAVTWNYNPAVTSSTFSSYLIRVNFGSGLTSISASAFTNCTKLLSISIPNTVTGIGNSAFSGCTGLDAINIPNGVTSIGSNAFYGCTGITSYTIPYSATSVGTNAFGGNPNCLVYWNYNPALTAANFGSVLHYIYWPSNITTISSNAFTGCTRFTSFSIPTTVKSIGNSAFYGCTGLTRIFIYSGTTLGTNVFQNCSKLYVYTSEISQPSYWSSSWNSSNRPIYWRMNSSATDIFSGFGYHGSTYYWDGAAQMNVSSNYYHNYDNGNYLLTANATLSFTVRTVNKKNALSKINGTLTFQLKNSSGTILQTNTCTVAVSITGTVTLSGQSFSINTSNLSNGTYTLTMISSFTRASWSESSTQTLTFIIDR